MRAIAIKWTVFKCTFLQFPTVCASYLSSLLFIALFSSYYFWLSFCSYVNLRNYYTFILIFLLFDFLLYYACIFIYHFFIFLGKGRVRLLILPFLLITLSRRGENWLKNTRICIITRNSRVNYVYFFSLYFLIVSFMYNSNG